MIKNVLFERFFIVVAISPNPFHIEAQNYVIFRKLQNFNPFSLQRVVTRLDV